MLKNSFLLFFLFTSTSLIGQISESNFRKLRKSLTEQINQLRISKKLPPLQSNIILRKAAKNQSVYMARIKKLSHKQNKFALQNPTNRVRHFKGYQFIMVGENVLHTARIRLPLSDQSIKSIANEMFNSWKNSPGHYANMIHPDYDFGDIDFQFDPTEKIIYATQVFGKEGVSIPGQLSTNAFGITEEKDESCFEAYDGFSNIVANMGNSLQVEGNKVMFYYHDLDYFNRVFPDRKDGMAIDLFFRNQVSCDGPNKIDYSPIYDGILLKPIYKEDILKNNTAKSSYRIVAQVGTIPDSLLSKEFSCSMILLKNGTFCKYLVPGNVPSKRYRLRPIKPVLLNPSGVHWQNEGIIASQEVHYDFKSNRTIPVAYPKIEKNNYSVHSIEITSFSSVEGDEQKNAILHKNRAQTIKKHLIKYFDPQQPTVTIDAKENWEKMYFQLRYFMANQLADLPKDSLRNIVNSDDRTLPWDSLLFDQRKSIATIYYQSSISDTSDYVPFLEMNFKTAIANKNFDLANKALFEMYQRDVDLSELLFEEAIFKTIIQVPDLTQNVAAILSEVYREDVVRTTEFLFSWFNRESELSIEAKNNLLHLYTLLSSNLLSEWDVSAKRLSNVVHPTMIEKLVNEKQSDELVLNLNLTFIRYFGQINDSPNIRKSFNFIVDYFKSRILKMENEIDLVLFFNTWSSYHLTNEYLLAKFEDDVLNEDAIFILLKTLYFYTSDDEEIDFYDQVYLKALELNEKRWCRWVDQEFQILRDEKVKDLFCKRCSK